MRIEIPAIGSTNEGVAPVNILREDGTRLCQLDIQFSKIQKVSGIKENAIDFLILASAVYSIDKLVLRSEAWDSWTRVLSLEIPVSDVAAWNEVKADLEKCLCFLSGDSWALSFYPRTARFIRPKYRKVRRSRLARASFATGDAVCLFSGGLDSLAGCIDWLQENPDRKLLLVGHHDGQMPGPHSDQKQLLDVLSPVYSGRINSVLMRVGHTNQTVDHAEITLRARSFIFLALGILAASSLGSTVPILIPENGTIALNVPLNPSRRGSCSTRTAHPYYLGLLSQILPRIGITNPIENPLEMKTKGEVIKDCKNQKLIEVTAPLSVSCAKRGHKVHWKNRDAKACGRCMPCIYRRAALHTLGLDNERYGDDICAGDVDVFANAEKGNDLKACLAFTRRNLSSGEISTLLLTNGSLEADLLPSYASMVARTFEEIRTLLRDKAVKDVKKLAGL